ncbi:hypothetical protein J2T17_007244 [Paenibacillus mucilaginosus]
METPPKRFIINVRGISLEVIVDESYIIHFFDEGISFHGLEARIEDTYWKDDGKTLFFIWVPEHNEDYLVSDEEIRSIRKKD